MLDSDAVDDLSRRLREVFGGPPRNDVSVVEAVLLLGEAMLAFSEILNSKRGSEPGNANTKQTALNPTA
jgi:hypothetical protein